MKNATNEWNLLLVATCASAPKRLLDPLAAAVVACRGWVLAKGEVSARCADIDFEFAREYAVEVYSLLVGMGVELSTEAHGQLTSLCQCTRHAGAGVEGTPVRVHLTLYAAEGGEAFLGEQSWGVREAA